MILRRLLLTCCLGLLATTLSAQENPVRDSLLARLAELPHDTLRLYTLQQIVLATENNINENRHYNDLLLDEAERQDNDRYRRHAYYTRMLAAYNTYDSVAFQAVRKELEPLVRRAKDYNTLFRIRRIGIELQLLSQDYEQSEREMQKMLSDALELDCTAGVLDAYQSLASIYRMTYRHRQAAEILEKALPLAIRQGSDPAIINTWQPLIFLYQDMADYTNWLRNLRKFESYLLSTLGPKSKDRIFLILYGSYLAYYTKLEDWPRAEQVRLKGERYAPHITTPLYRIYFDRLCATYFASTGQHENALNKLLAAKSYMEELSRGVDYYSITFDQAELLSILNRPEEALPLYKQVLNYKDSLHVATINTQYEQLKKSFKSDTLLLEQAQIQHQVRLYTLLLLALGLLVGIGLFIYLLRSHRALKRAEGDMREMTRSMEQANDAKDRFLSNISTTINDPLNIVIDGSMKLATNQVDDPDERQLLAAKIRKMSSNLMRVINDILDLSRLEAGMMKYDITEVEINTLLLDAASVSSAPRGVDFQAEYPEQALFTTRADAGRLLQVFTSLFERASKGVEQISLTARMQSKNLHLHITGTLLAEEHLSQEAIIRNEINRMLIAHFGGSYQIAPGSISVLLPITEVPAAES